MTESDIHTSDLVNTALDDAKATSTRSSRSVFSSDRDVLHSTFALRYGELELDKRQTMDGLILLAGMHDSSTPLVFFDPQYRTILDKLKYGNEGKGRGRARAVLPQMDAETIRKFIAEIERVLIPSGHLMLWIDKYIVCSGINDLVRGSNLKSVDMITWNKDRMGMGYRTRRCSEYLLVLQKRPVRAKGVWCLHNIPDVWAEKISNKDKNHTHAKPIGLQQSLIQAVSNKGDVIVDPAAGGYSVMGAAHAVGRRFLGCDVLG